MKTFYRQVVNHPRLIITIYAALLVVCLLCKPFIEVNYDMNDYLPEDSASTVALNTMEAEYEGGITNARVMVKDVTVAQALEYKEKLQKVEGVTEVTWLDDVADIAQPLNFIENKTLETYYKNDAALFSVTIDDEKGIDACEDIREIIGDDNCMSGSAVSTAVSTTSSVEEIPLIGVFGVAFTLLVMILTTTSWAEPFIVLIGLGVAVLINSGSNIIFGEISLEMPGQRKIALQEYGSYAILKKYRFIIQGVISSDVNLFHFRTPFPP